MTRDEKRWGGGRLGIKIVLNIEGGVAFQAGTSGEPLEPWRLFHDLLRRVSLRWPLAVGASLLVIRASETRLLGWVLEKPPTRRKP